MANPAFTAFRNKAKEIKTAQNYCYRSLPREYLTRT